VEWVHNPQCYHIVASFPSCIFYVQEWWSCNGSINEPNLVLCIETHAYGITPLPIIVPIKWFESYNKSSMIRVVYGKWKWEFHGILIWFHVFGWFYHGVCERFVVVMGGLQWLWWWKCDKVTKIGTLITTWIENLDIVLYWILVHK